MILTPQEENKNRVISAVISSIIFGLLLLFLILYQMITPNPPFPESGGGGGQELSLGMMNVGNDNVDFGSMGSITDVVQPTEENKEEIVVSENGLEVPIEKEKTKTKNHKKIVKPIKQKEVVKEKTEAEKLAEKFKKNTGKNGGGIGNNTEAGENGSPDGDPFKNGTGGTGNGTGGGNGDGDGNGTGPGSGGGMGGRIGVSLKGRALVRPPKLPTDTKEEGKVVVNIVVDSEGTVIEAIPNGRGTTTSSAVLKAKAKQAALATKFDVNGKFEEQNGTITIIFSFN